MLNYDKMRKELRKMITPDTVFVCIGTNKVRFDEFGPLCGTLLKNKGIPCFGTCEDNVNALTMNHKLDLIYNGCKINNKDIIAIDAAVTASNSRVNKLKIQKGLGVHPGAGVGKTFPVVGENSVIMFTLNKTDLKETMNGYRTGKGRVSDLSNEEIIFEKAVMLTNIIEEVYNEVCNTIII